MTYSIHEASPTDLKSWDSFVANSVNGTLFHRRDFLSYHGDRFSNGEKFLVACKGNTVVAQVSLNVGDDGVAVSPYGGSYGGFVFKTTPTLVESREIVQNLIAWGRARRITVLRLTQPPSFCCKQNLDTFYYSLLVAGFKSLRREISSVVELVDHEANIESVLSSKTRNKVKVAKKRGVSLHRDVGLDEFWPMMESTFNRHGVRPTHSKEELSRLISILPNEVKVTVARQNGVNLAGLVEFEINPQVQSSFYFCRSAVQSQALSVLVTDALDRAISDGHKFYDFGTSTALMQSRDNVFSFKESFGANGYFRETFEWREGG